MRTHLLIAALLLSCAPLAAFAGESDEAAIRGVIERAYIQGVWVQRDPDLVRSGFAPTFVMQVYWQGELSSRTLDQWIERMKLDKVPREHPGRGEIKILEITGQAAVARVDVFVESEHKYTDYFGLYRTEEGWRIVSKHFHSHSSAS